MRPLLARAGRLVAELTLGRGDAAHLRALDEVALELGAQGLAAAWPLGSSLRYYREQWEQHARRESCPEGLCFEHQAAPCHGTCPANIDIPSFIAHIGHGDYRAAIEVIRRDNPLPLTCGLVCPAPCESACVRGGSNGAVFIRPMKAKAAEHCLADGGYPKPQIAPDSGKRIGIAGSGPAGLTAAYYLRTFGHEVEILEEQEKAGGMLRYGIPAYRLPPDLLDQELDQIRALGIAIRTSAEVGSLDAFRKNYDAVFLGLGTQRSRLIPIDGVHQSFVLGGIDFLRDVRSGEPVRVGPRVIVVGGGNVAIDVALTALRQGATHVDMVSLEKRREMPASAHEIENAVGEGVQLHPGWGPVRIGADGEATFQFCEQVHDETGKFDPKFDAARLLTLEGDHVILATGQGTDLTILDGSGVETTHGFILTDPKTLMTKVPGVYAGGDVEHGPRTVVEAIRSGKIAANAIDAWLRGQPMDNATGTAVRRADVLPLTVAADERTHLPRAVMPERTVEEVVGLGNYVQIEEGLTDAMAHDEARRCLRCDVCIGCGLCMAACSEMGVDALRMADTDAGRLAYFDFTRPAELCIGCGACSQVCPTGAIRIADEVDLSAGGGTAGPRAPHDHHGNHRVRAAAADLQRMRRADADACAPAIHPRSPAGSHGGPSGPRALPVMCAAAGRSSRSKRCRARGSAGSPATQSSTPGDCDHVCGPAEKAIWGAVMKAVTVQPGVAGSVRFEEVPEPDQSTGSILVQAVAVGICGTDVEIASGAYGWAPPGRDRLILGHESLGRVVDPGPGSGLQAGDLIVGIVRRPDPVPCPNCAVGEWDMCRNGQYTERGIKQIDGFMSERWRIEPGYFTKLDPSLGILGVLLEPATVVAKAWELVAAMRARAFWEPRHALVTGAGPIGMLAALIGVQHGLDVHVLDQVTEGAKPQLVADLGATYHTGAIDALGLEPDVVIECTGVGSVIIDSIRHVGAGGVVCLTGVGSGGAPSGLSPADVAKAVVLQNNVVLGSVNANRRHFYRAAEELARADRAWLARLISRRVPPQNIADALQRGPDDIKVVVDFGG